jgi:TRAP-type transport system periplasmic protein
MGLVAVSAAATSLAACGAQQADKSGAKVQPTATLTLAMPDHGDRLGAEFAKAVALRSHGSVRIRIDPDGYSNVVPANELRLARALQGGKADVGYLPARAWSAAGIGAFKALLAPFALTTDEATQTLASSPVARDVLAALPDSVVGLALVPAESRRVLAVRPPLSPAAFKGMRVRVVDDPQAAAAIESLGARAVEGLRSDAVGPALRDRRLDGAETAPTYALSNGYWNGARHLSGYGVFPKLQSIVLSRRTWQRLSGAQQAAMRAAAADTVRSARSAVPEQEQSDLRQLCAAGVRISVPSAAQLQALTTAAQPAVASLAEDGAAARVLAAIRALPGSGPQRLASPLPASCTARDRDSRSASGQTAATFPNGVYVVKVTAAQFHAHGATGSDWNRDTTLTTRFRDGRWSQLQRPTYPTQCPAVATRSHPACSGTYKITGDQMLFSWSYAPPPVPAPETVKWSYFNRVLRFKPVDVADPSSLAIWAQPWRRIR